MDHVIPPLNADQVQALIDRAIEEHKTPQNSMRAVGQPAPTEEEFTEMEGLYKEGETTIDGLPDHLRDRVREGGVLLKASEYATAVVQSNPMLMLAGGPELGSKISHGFVMGFTVAALAADDAARENGDFASSIDELLKSLPITGEDDQR